MFVKSAVAIHSLILHATEVDLSVYIRSDLASICRSRCYNWLLRYSDGLFRVKRLAKESEQKPEAKKSLKFGDANVNNNTSQSITSVPRVGIGAFQSASPSLPPAFTFIAAIALLLQLLAPNGLLENKCFRRNNTRFHWPIVDLHGTKTSRLSETRPAQNSKTDRQASS